MHPPVSLASSCIFALTVGSPALAQTDWWVDASGTPPGTGMVNDPYTSIDDALAASTTVDGDRINVRAGTYLEHGVDFRGKGVSVVSSDGIGLAVIDARQQGTCVVFRSGEGPTSRLEGVTLRNGSGAALPGGGTRAGGGAFIQGASPTLLDCRIVFNFDDPSIELGGGVFLVDSSAELYGCTFEHNSAVLGGGVAMLSSTPRFADCTFEDNGPGALITSDRGGAVYSDSTSSPTFRDCAFLSNTAARGGAISGPARVEDSIFERNVGQYGGGAYGGMGTPGGTELERCVLVGNQGFGYTSEGGYGGGAFGCVLRDCELIDNVASSGGGVNACEVERCTFRGNRAVEVDSLAFSGYGGAAADSSLVESTFSANSTLLVTPLGGVPGLGGGAWRCSAVRCVFFENVAGQGGGASQSSLDRCTVWGNRGDTGGDGVQDCDVTSSIVRNNGEELGGSCSAAYSDVEGGFAGAGNVDLDPLFADPSDGDFHLLPGSPVVDLGSPSAPPDFDGTRADMGSFPGSDCNDNRVVDATDISSQTSVDSNGNGFPDECECKVDSVCATAPNSLGTGARIDFSGSVSVGQNDFTLRATGCPPNETGLFYYGMLGAEIPFGDGLRCIRGRVFRLPLTQVSSQGVAATAVDNTSPPAPGGQLSAGSIGFFQFFYRDPSSTGGSGFNLSDALRVRFCE